MNARARALAALTMTAAVLTGPARVSADELLFDDLGLGERDALTDQYGFRGVTFSGIGAATPRVVSATHPVFPGDPQGLYIDDGTSPGYQGALIATFAFPVNSAGAWIDFGIVDRGIKIEAFDGPGGTGALLGTTLTGGETLLALQIPGIRSIVFSQVRPQVGVQGATYLIDHLTFTVPAPASVLVLAGAVLARRARPVQYAAAPASATA